MSGFKADAFLGAVAGQGSNTDIDQASEALTSTQKALAVSIKALDGNTDKIYISVDGTDATTADYELGAGDSTPWLPVPSNDLANINVIGGANDQGACWLWIG